MSHHVSYNAATCGFKNLAQSNGAAQYPPDRRTTEGKVGNEGNEDGNIFCECSWNDSIADCEALVVAISLSVGVIWIASEEDEDEEDEEEDELK